MINAVPIGATAGIPGDADVVATGRAAANSNATEHRRSSGNNNDYNDNNDRALLDAYSRTVTTVAELVSASVVKIEVHGPAEPPSERPGPRPGPGEGSGRGPGSGLAPDSCVPTNPPVVRAPPTPTRRGAGRYRRRPSGPLSGRPR